MVLPVKISIDSITHLAHTIDITGCRGPGLVPSEPKYNPERS